MRGALEKVPGVTGAEIEAGKTDIVVSYDASVTDTDKILAGLKAGEHIVVSGLMRVRPGMTIQPQPIAMDAAPAPQAAASKPTQS